MVSKSFVSLDRPLIRSDAAKHPETRLVRVGEIFVAETLAEVYVTLTSVVSRFRKHWTGILIPAVMMTITLAFTTTVTAQVSLNEISTDLFTNTNSQHATEVEPASYSFGNTIVSVFQQGRFNLNGGASDIGWATSRDGGMTWQHGSLPGITTIEGSGTFDRASDPAVIYDAKHGVWLIATLPVLLSGAPRTAMLISRSRDGLNWNNPVNVTPNVENSDKTWVSCDNNQNSPFFGHCYAEWDDNLAGDVIFLNTSADGGQTWRPAKQPQNGPTGLGGLPLAQPNGTVIVPSADAFVSSLIAYRSLDGGGSWTSTTTIATLTTHTIAGGLRDLNLPNAAMDASGRTYVFWHDCRFRAGCTSNDIVFSWSDNGTTWSAPIRVPIDDTTSTVDHFIPGVAIQRGTSRQSAHIGVSYYFYPDTNCTGQTCLLMEGYISSPDGGRTWTAPTTVAGPMNLFWLPNTSLGQMVGDYQAVSFVGSLGFPIFDLANANNGTAFDEATYAPVTGFLSDVALYSSEFDQPVLNAHSDHPPRTSPVKDND